MTLTMAWIRNSGESQELIFCSDSRLRFGCAWDSCQKIFPLPRGDCAIAFSGDTQFAYPFIHTASNAISFHRASSRRQIDLCEAKSVLLNAINATLSEIRDLPRGREKFEEPDLRLLFGGFSWKKKKFFIWKFFFDNGEREFREIEATPWKGAGSDRVLMMLGEPNASASATRKAIRLGAPKTDAHEDVEAMARNALIKKLEDREVLQGSGFDMEPMQVLVDLIRSKSSPHVAGAPQLVKVYQHLNTQVFGVSWPDSNGRTSVLGRILPSAEKVHIPIVDPDTFRVKRTRQS